MARKVWHDFQDFCLVPRLDVITNVLLGRLSYTSTLKSFFKLFSEQDQARAIELLQWLNMLPHALQRAENLWWSDAAGGDLPCHDAEPQNIIS